LSSPEAVSHLLRSRAARCTYTELVITGARLSRDCEKRYLAGSYLIQAEIARGSDPRMGNGMMVHLVFRCSLPVEPQTRCNVLDPHHNLAALPRFCLQKVL